MFLNSVPQTPNLILCTLQKAFSKINKKKKKKRKKGKKSDYFTQPRKCSTDKLAGWCNIQEKKNIQETILLQPFIEKIYTIESSES